MNYPRPITEIHQIEPTTFCDLRCVYCPSKDLDKARYRGQPRMHMELDVFAAALEWARWFEVHGTQRELNLTGIGETLLHPQLAELCEMARDALPTVPICFSTNGLKLTDDICRMLAEHDITLDVSLHRPEKAGPAIEKAKRHGIFHSANAGASVSSFDWAGQLNWPVSAPKGPCAWLGIGWANVLVDGRITACCYDAAAKGVVGHVVDDRDKIGTLGIKPFELCGPCHLSPP